MTTKRSKPALPQMQKMLGAAAARRIERTSSRTRRSHAYRHGRRTLGILLASLALTGTALAAVTGWDPLTNQDIYRGLRQTCGSFHARIHGEVPYRIVVTNAPGGDCGAAMEVIEAFWGPREGVIHHGGQIVANSYYTLDRVPGWRCSEAAGAGVCSSRGGEVAEYQVELLRPRLVLGAAAFQAPIGEGWGTAEPGLLFNGGDPAGRIDEIRWRSWGGETAIGWGKTSTGRPQGGYYDHQVRIQLRAEDIGPCRGRRAYRHLLVREPNRPGGRLGHWQSWWRGQSLCVPAH